MTDRPKLRSVNTGELQDPPYPGDTKANGFRPEIDWQRIKASKTWRLCPPEARNHLLRLWLESWNEIPAGSWEADDEIIAIAIDMAPGAFAGYRQHLMRGWVRHNDGRLYHPFVTEMVQVMLSRRRGATERVARHRARKEQKASAESPTEPTVESREVTGCNTLPAVTYTKEQEQEQDIYQTSLREVCRASPTPAPKTAEVERVLTHLNTRTGSAFKTHNNAGRLTANAKLVQARLQEHGTDALLAVIDRKVEQWGRDPKMREYLRPETLFGARKCEQYVGQLSMQQRDGVDDWLNGSQGGAAPIEGDCKREP